MQYDSLTEAVRLLGCFSDAVDIQPLFDTNIQENDTIVQEQSLDAEVDINRVVWEEFFWKSPENQWDFIDYFYINNCFFPLLLHVDFYHLCVTKQGNAVFLYMYLYMQYSTTV